VNEEIVGILLAAGKGLRFGSDKLLHPLDDGILMARRSARSLRAALPKSVAVVRRAESPLARFVAEEGLRVVACGAADKGMGASIACGVAAQPEAAGWVICLADMPFVRPDTIAAVAQALRQGAVLAAPLHAGLRGHPVGFGRRFRDDLLALNGDRGGRSLIAAHAEQLQLIQTDDAGVLLDVDVPGDLRGPQALMQVGSAVTVPRRPWQTN
jgi:molybdenum cofactor cytidylyltransferase